MINKTWVNNIQQRTMLKSQF